MGTRRKEESNRTPDMKKGFRNRKPFVNIPSEARQGPAMAPGAKGFSTFSFFFFFFGFAGASPVL